VYSKKAHIIRKLAPFLNEWAYIDGRLVIL
jgi:hypothetical protein